MIVLDSEGNFLRSWGEELLFSWGASGTDPGEFGYPHNVVTDKDGYVYVADRENDRIQIFDSNGRFETQWHNVNRPNGLYITDEQNIYVTEAVQNAMARSIPNFHFRAEQEGRDSRQNRQRVGNEPGQFMATHHICLDSDHKDLHV